MDTVTFRPSWSKVALQAALSATLLSVGSVILTALKSGELMDPLLIVIIVGSSFAMFALNGVVYSLPHFKVEVKDGHLVGPSAVGWPFGRVSVPIASLDLQHIDKKWAWYGNYVLSTGPGKPFLFRRLYSESSILLWGFDEQQFNRLLELLRKNAAA